MKKYLMFLLLILPLLIVFPTQAREGNYRCGYHELLADDTLTTDASATDSTIAYTTFHESFSDTSAWSFYLLAKETGAQVNNTDINIYFSVDSTSGWSAPVALVANLDVGGTCPDKWYDCGTTAAMKYVKWIRIAIGNTDSDANLLIVKSFGIVFKEAK